VDEIVTTSKADPPFLILPNIRPTLHAPGHIFLIIIRGFLRNIIFNDPLSFNSLNEKNFLPAIRTPAVELPPPSGALQTAEFVAAV